MTGALGLQGGHLDATILLNLDTEDDDEISDGDDNDDIHSTSGGEDSTGDGGAVSK